MANPAWLVVVVVYALAVWLVRRGGVRLPLWIAALFLILVLGFLWRPLTQDVISFPADIVRLMPPWSEMLPPNRAAVTKYEVSNLNLHDLTMQTVPWTYQVRESLKAFHIPLWNAAAGCGYPLLANGQSTPFSPFRLITLLLPLAYAISAEAALRLLVALVGTYLFCRRRYSDAASVIGAICYGFSTWMTTWLHFPIASASAFLPVALLTIDLLIDGFTRTRFVAAVAVFAVAVFSGHPETLYHVGLIAAAYALWRLFVEKRAELEPPGSSRLKRLGSIAAAALLAAFITAPVLGPFVEAVARSQRLAELRVPHSIIPPYSNLACAFLLLQPNFFGHLPLDRPWGPTGLESICSFSGVLAIAAAFGAVPWLLLRRRWRDREAFYVIALFLTIAVLFAWPGFTDAAHAVAGLAPLYRLRIALCWFVSLLAAAMIDASREDTRLPLLFGAATTALLILLLMRLTSFPSDAHRDLALLAFLPSLLVLALIPLLGMRRGGTLVTAAIAIATIAELWAAIEGWNPVLPRREMFRATPLVRALDALRRNETAAEPFRVIGIGPAFYPNVSAMMDIEDVRVHDPMANARFVKFLEVTGGWNPAQYYARWNDADTRVIDLLNARYVITEPRFEMRDRERYRIRYDGRDGRIFENGDVLPRFFAARNVIVEGRRDSYFARLAQHRDWATTAFVRRIRTKSEGVRTDLLAPRAADSPEASVSILRASSDRTLLHVNAPRHTLIVSSVAIWPGWRIRAGDRALDATEVNGSFLGFVAPPGDYEVEVAYAPRSFWGGLVAAFLALAGLGVWWRWPPRAARRDDAVEESVATVG